MEEIEQLTYNTNDLSQSQIKNYIIIQYLNRGSQGKVKLCQNINDGKYYAIKILKDIEDTNKVQNIENEYKNLKQVQGHQNILSVIDFFKDTYIKKHYQGRYKAICLVLELVENGAIFDYVNVMKGINQNFAKYYFKCLMNGLKHLHEKGICHRDIKMENILLDKDYVLKICDLGLCGNIYQPLNNFPGTKRYMAPEIISRIKGYNGEKYDVFSSGVFLYTILTQNYPFYASENDKFYLTFLKKNQKFWQNSKKQCCKKIKNTDFFDDPDFIELMNNMLEQNPDKRWTVQQVLDSAYLNKQDMENGKPVNISQEQIKEHLSKYKNEVSKQREQFILHKKQINQQNKQNIVGYQNPQTNRAFPQNIEQSIKNIEHKLNQENKLLSFEKLNFPKNLNKYIQEQLQNQQIQVILRKQEVIPVLVYIMQSTETSDYKFNFQNENSSNIIISQNNCSKIIAQYIDINGEIIEIQTLISVSNNQKEDISDFNIYNIYFQLRSGDYICFKQIIDKMQALSIQFQ